MPQSPPTQAKPFETLLGSAPPPAPNDPLKHEKVEGAIWVISNRQDDRVVLSEKHPDHPGGEAFVGGSAPDYVFRTPEIERCLRDGLMVEIPEPPEGRKKPIPLSAVDTSVAAAQPGQPTQLGRKFDPEIVPDGALQQVQQKQEEAPESVPVPRGVIVPSTPGPDRQRSSS